MPRGEGSRATTGSITFDTATGEILAAAAWNQEEADIFLAAVCAKPRCGFGKDCVAALTDTDLTAERTELCARPEIGFSELAGTLDDFFVNLRRRDSEEIKTCVTCVCNEIKNLLATFRQTPLQVDHLMQAIASQMHRRRPSGGTSQGTGAVLEMPQFAWTPKDKERASRGAVEKIEADAGHQEHLVQGTAGVDLFRGERRGTEPLSWHRCPQLYYVTDAGSAR
eukprot:s41_g4.t1